MNFNLDDPLAGILSDGSDDSFFDDDIIGKKKTPKKKATTPIAEKKSALFDLGDTEDVSSKKPQNAMERRDSLFGLGDSVPIAEDVKPPVRTESKSPAPFRRAVSKESIDFASSESAAKLKTVPKSPSRPKPAAIDKLNILGEMGTASVEDNPKTVDKGIKSQGILDDILGGSSSKLGTNLSQNTRSSAAAKSQEFDLDSILGKSESKLNIASNKPSKQNVKPEIPKQEATSKKVSQPKKKSSDDWLGIFDTKKTEDEEDDAMPSWLLGDKAPKKKRDDQQEPPSIAPKPQTPVKEQKEVGRMEEIPKELGLNVMVPSSNLLHASNEDITTEGANLCLQQQESQLMVALQLKAQEEKLAAMQMRQEESSRLQRAAAQAHQAQVDAILRRQADNRRQMQEVIAAHQDRITERIRALLGPPKDVTETAGDENNETQTEQRDSPHMKEKKQLLQLVQSLQENHDKEIDLMETSYRRQIAFLEISLSQGEERMKEESEKVVKYYLEKINWLEEHHHLHKKMTEENLKSIAERHKAENEMLRQQHLENIKVLQEHHASLMENIKNSVKQEQVLIKDSTEFSSNLLEIVADVQDSKSQIKLLVEKVQSIAENSQRDTEKSLQSREKQIGDLMQQLTKERENFDVEKNESREMVKLLETRLKQMTSLIEEESANLKQKRMEFEFEKATFNKQTEFAKNVLKKQDEEIKMIKDDIQKEYHDKIAKIEEEKSKAQKDGLAAAKAKSTIQNLHQELERMKAELQAQLEEVNEERSKLNIDKQQLHMEEQRVLARSRDLDLLAKTAVEKQTQADKKYSEAEFIQRKYEERKRRIQEHAVSLNSREKQIAKEKVALSRERLSIHNEKKQIESRQQCSLCKSTQNMSQYANYDACYTLPDSFLNVPVTRDFTSANLEPTLNPVDTEISTLLRRQFSAINASDINNVGIYENDHVMFNDNFESIKRDANGPLKDYMDPKFMMLRLDVQKVISNLKQNEQEDESNEDSLEGNHDV
ncbi:unnamed protein product [Plutella xylostella]|uniref:(diamondback moth) hypothetical protein n=1 Tax=Plutella xylostella TaxID=51655 RepID=A0A8S4CXZ3_PLUXY|nr:unnamed protein product [Plutella xylostella]